MQAIDLHGIQAEDEDRNSGEKDDNNEWGRDSDHPDCDCWLNLGSLDEFGVFGRAGSQ